MLLIIIYRVFVIININKVIPRIIWWINIYHFDLYRISDSEDLESIGYHEYVESDAHSIVEWSERVPEYIPEDAITVTISRVPEDETVRVIEITGGPI